MSVIVLLEFFLLFFVSLDVRKNCLYEIKKHITNNNKKVDKLKIKTFFGIFFILSLFINLLPTI